MVLPAKVNISTKFRTVIDINERDHKVELKFEIYLEWYEVRARYYNLKTISAQNVLKPEELAKIWIPYVIFMVTTDRKLKLFMLFLFRIQIPMLQ